MKYQIDYVDNQDGGNQKGGMVAVNYNNIINDLQNAVYLILRLNNGGGVLLSPTLVNSLQFDQYIYGIPGLNAGGFHVTSKFFNNHGWIFNLTQYGSYYHLTLVNDNGIRPGVLTNSNFGFNFYPTYVPAINYITPPGTTLLVNQPVVKYKVDYYDEDDDEKLDFDKDYDIEESVRKVNKKSSKKRGSKKKRSKKK